VNAVLGALAASAATLAGGWLAVRARDRLAGLLAISGVLLAATACFELLPESFALARRGACMPQALAAAIAGFAAFHAMERLGHHGALPALAVVAHSFLDGMGIGLAFQVSASSGGAVAAGVVAHDFCDGLNVASLMLNGRAGAGRTACILLLDAAAPLGGSLSSTVLAIGPGAAALQSGFLGGLLLAIGADGILRATSAAGA
jgi:ZIP family zinc transporter